MPETNQPEAGVFAILRAWAANLVLSSADMAVSVSVGGIFLGGSLLFDPSRQGSWFIVGAALPMGLLARWATSKRAFKEELAMFHQLHEEGQITDEDYDLHRTRILEARADRLQGRRINVTTSAKPADDTKHPDTTDGSPKPEPTPDSADKTSEAEPIPDSIPKTQVTIKSSSKKKGAKPGESASPLEKNPSTEPAKQSPITELHEPSA